MLLLKKRKCGRGWFGPKVLVAFTVSSCTWPLAVAFSSFNPLPRAGYPTLPPAGLQRNARGPSLLPQTFYIPSPSVSKFSGHMNHVLPPLLSPQGSHEVRHHVGNQAQVACRTLSYLAVTGSFIARRRRQQRCLSRVHPLQSSAAASPMDEGEESWSASELPSYRERPRGAPAWIPTWVVTLHPLIQVLVMVALYFFHMLVLSKVAMPFPFQLVPNTHGLFQSIGMDSLAGLLVLGAAAYFRRARGLPLKPVVFGARPLPFNPPKRGRGKVWRILFLLMVAYLTSGSASKWVEDVFGLSELNVALGRAVQVLAGHLVWVLLGVGILKTQAGEGGDKPFFGKKSVWMKSSWNTYWLWWAIGGYYVSSLAFHVADTVNQVVLPASAFEVDSVVTQMINPEGNDVVAMLVGSLAPCVSAPWWEEVLYRGFLLPALYLFYPADVATLVSAVIFAAHHMSMSGMIPLTTLGYLWAVLYLLSGNLLVPIAIHSLWNSRVFLGSLLGI